MRRRDLVFGLLGASLLPMLAKAATPRRFVVGSTLISDIVSDLLQDGVELRELIAGVACPGHTDVKASDLVFALRSEGLLVHGFQRRLPSLRQMLSIEPKLKDQTTYIEVRSSWLIPAVQIEASETLAALLLQRASLKEADLIRGRLQKRVARIRSVERECASIRKALQGKQVIGAKMQEEFLVWTGLQVVGTFGSADTLDPRSMTDLIRKGRERSLIGIVDNLQSGPDTGRPIAEELRLPRVVLSNFPKSSKVTPDYDSLVRDNMHRLASLLVRN